jgi:DNA adenine methylase
LKESGNKNGSLRPIVKWAGGKRQLLPTLRQFYPKNFHRYIEPFLGGAIMYLTLKPSLAVLGDSNRDLIDCYTTVRDRIDELIKALENYAPHVLDKEFYYGVRDRDAADLAPVERAARFIFLNKTCYNGLYRVNRNGRFNVPFGKHKRPPRLYDETNLRGVALLLQNAELVTGDFEETVQCASEGDFLYLDPPYHRSGNSHFTAYSVNGFTENDHVRLAKIFRTLHARGCKLLLCNSDTILVRELYRDFVVIPIITSRAINCVAEKRNGFPEVLIVNHGEYVKCKY